MSNARIDVHNHIIPKPYLAGLERAGILSSGGIPYPQWSPELALGLMDRHGIQTAVTSVSSPGVVFGNQQIATDLAHEINEYSATLIADHPKRFGAFGHIPLPDVDAALSHPLEVEP